MSDENQAALAVILVEPTDYARIRQSVRHLAQQTAQNRLELVFVVNSAHAFDLDRNAVKDFRHVRIVEVGAIDSMASARAAGIRATTAPVIALTENHAFPEPHWAEALINAHEQTWAAVGPVINISNPNSAVSWAMHFMTYAKWSDPIESGSMDDLPGHNSSYKRALLLDYDAELETLLQAETVLHWDLRRKGYQLYLESGAKTNHHISTRLSSILAELLYFGRTFASIRARKWNPARRLFYAAAAPLVPVIRFARIAHDIRRSNQRLLTLLRILPIIWLGLITSAAAEMLGYLFGAGNSVKKLSDYEIDHCRRESRKA